MINSYSGGDVTKMDRIAKISIMPKKKFGISTEYGDAHVVEIFQNETNFFYNILYLNIVKKIAYNEKRFSEWKKKK